MGNVGVRCETIFLERTGVRNMVFGSIYIPCPQVYVFEEKI